LRKVGLKHVTLDNGQARLIAEFRAQILNQHRVDFDGNHALGAFQQVGSECPSAGSDFDYDFGALRARGLSYALQNFFANQEVLA
jgi:hypothetical protein